MANSAHDYIQSYRGDGEALVASLDRIRSASAAILEALDGSGSVGGG